MSLHRVEGFDAFGQTDGASINSGAAFVTKWGLDTGTAEVTQPGRDGVGKSVGLAGAAGISTPTFAPAIETVLIGFAFKVVSVANPLVLCFPRFNSNTSRSNLIVNTDGTISVRRGSTVLATTVDAYDDNTWRYAEFKTKMTLSAGSYELKIDGVTVASDPNVSMDDTGTSGTNNIFFGAGTGNEVHIDDVYILNCDGSGLNDFLGPVKVINRVPTADGSVTWTPSSGSNFAAIDELPPDGDTSYVETSGASNIDTYNIADVDANYSYFGMQLNFYAKGSSSSLRHQIVSNGNTENGAAQSLSGSYSTYFTLNEKNPDGNVDWATATLNAATFGFQQQSGTPRNSRFDIDIIRSYAETADPLEVTAENSISLTDSAQIERPMNAKAGIFTAPNTTGNQSVTGLGFQPSIVVFFPSYSDFQDDPLSTPTEIGMSVNMGAAAADDTQCAVSWHAISGSGSLETSQGLNRIANNRCIQTINSSAVTVWEGSIVSMDSDGFTINWDKVVAASAAASGPHLFKVRYLALGGPAITDSTIAEFDSEAAPGTQSYNVGFQPDATIFLSSPLTTSNTGSASADPNGFGIGYADNLKNQGANAISVWQEGSLGSGESGAYSSWQQFGRAILQLQVNDLFSSGEGEPLSEAVLTNWEATGFELDWLTAVAAHKFFAICLKGGGYRVINGTEPSTTGLHTLYTPRVKPVALMGQSRCLQQGDDPTTWGVFTHGITDGVSQSYMTVAGKPSTISNQQQVWDTTSTLRLATISTVASAINQRSRATISTLDENSFNLSWLVNFPDSRELIFMAFGEDHLGPVTATNTLDTLDQDVDVTAVYNRSTSDLLTMSDQARGPFPVSASDIVSLAQSATKTAHFNRTVLDTIVLTSVADQVRVADDVIPIDDDVQVIKSKNISQTITLTDAAHVPEAAGDVLILLDSAKVPIHAFDRINLQDVAAIVAPPGALFASSRLELTDSAVVLKNLHLFASNTIELSQALAALPIRSNCEWPGIDTPTGTLTKGIKLEGDTTVDISRSMNMGDVNRLAFNRIVRETRGGTLRVFADPNWSKTETLVFSISGIKRAKSQEVLTFLLAHLGRDITLETHEGRRWLGVVLNPNDVVVEDRPNSFTISIEFEGILQTA